MRVPHRWVLCKGGRRYCVYHLISLWTRDQTRLARHFRFPPLAKNAKERGTHCVGNARKINSPGQPAERLWTSSCDRACTLVIHDNGAIRAGYAFRHLEGCRDPTTSATKNDRSCQRKRGRPVCLRFREGKIILNDSRREAEHSRLCQYSDTQSTKQCS